jgi:ATP-dependent Lon protease
MAHDKATKSDKKQAPAKNAKKADDKSRKKKSGGSSSGSDNEEEEEEEEMDMLEYRKLLSTLFPSKNMDKKVKAGEKLKEAVAVSEVSEKKKKDTKKKKIVEEEEEIWETTEEEEENIVMKPKNNRTKNNTTKGKSKRQLVCDSEDSSSDYVPSDEQDDDTEESDDEADKSKNNSGVKFYLTIGGGKDDYDDEYDDDDDYDDEAEEDESDTEDEDASVSSDDDDDDDDEDNDDELSSSDGKLLSRKRMNTRSCCKKDKCMKKTTQQDEKPNRAHEEALLLKLKELQVADKDNKTIQQCISVCEENMKEHNKKTEKKQKKQKAKNLRIFKKITKDKNVMNDFTFYDKLDVEKQKTIIKELREINKFTRIEKPYRMTLLEADIPVQYKSAAMKKINSIRYMDPGSGEYYKNKNWIDTFMRIPFGKHDKLPISIEDGVEKCHEFMENARRTLDDAVHGLNDAKMQIMQLTGQLITNPKAVGSSIGLYGPPGTGKTSLIQDGIAKILGRKTVFIPLGGAKDSSYLVGHGFTYEGSLWGKIVQGLIDAGSMSVVFVFDEVDKLSQTQHGDEITGVLTHLIDSTQNDKFTDVYFNEVLFDLSKCMFVFSYNDESLVNPILRDRMYRIKTEGYDQKQKTVISNKYLMPKIREQVKFTTEDIIIPDDSIHHMIDKYCENEQGVRNLKRCLEIIHTKLNLYRLMKPGSNLFEKDMSLKVEFPFTVTKEFVDTLIKKNEKGVVFNSMYM